MSASNSEDSIDWLASDEDAGPKRSSPQRAEESPLPPPPPSPPSSSSLPSSSSIRESPTSCFHSERKKKRRRSDPLDGGHCGVNANSPAVAPHLGSTSASERLSAAPRHHTSGRRIGGDKTPPDSEKELFSQKRAELQRYVQPLSSILRDLRSGRYSDRLSSFQESVAMDRIQRIMGVLQNPHMSGRFLSIILKIEAMLQSWFLHIRPERPQKQKHHRGASSPPLSSVASLCSSRRLHAVPVYVLKSPRSPPARATTSAPPAQHTQEVTQKVTQDSAVSSSTDLHLGPPPLRRLGFKIRSPVLERLLQAKQSIIAPRTEREDAW